MKKFKKILSLLLMSLLIIGFALQVGSQTKEQTKIKLVNIKGEVNYKSDGWLFFSTPWEKVKEEKTLEVGDIIKTGEEGRAEVVFANQARILIKSTSKVKIAKNKTGEIKLKRINLSLGEVMIKFIEEVGENNKFEVKTPSAVAGIRGTLFQVKVTEKKETTVSVEEGNVEVSSNVGSVEVQAGKKAEVKNKDEAPQVKPMSEKEKEKWKEEKEWLNKVRNWSERAKKKAAAPAKDKAKDKPKKDMPEKSQKPDSPPGKTNDSDDAPGRSGNTPADNKKDSPDSPPGQNK